jgi:hypothetical protein
VLLESRWRSQWALLKESPMRAGNARLSQEKDNNKVVDIIHYSLFLYQQEFMK